MPVRASPAAPWRKGRVADLGNGLFRFTKPAFDIHVKLGLVIIIVRQSAVDLCEAQVGMLPLDLISVPVMRQSVHRHLDDLDRRARKDGYTLRGDFDMCIRYRWHVQAPVGYADSSMLLHCGNGNGGGLIVRFRLSTAVQGDNPAGPYRADKPFQSLTPQRGPRAATFPARQRFGRSIQSP